MIIDIIFVILMGLAIFKGGSKGLIVALFSIVGFIIGLAAALKLSTVVAGRIAPGSSAPWMPFLSFILVFIAVMVLVRLWAKILEKSVQFIMLGWLNKLGGIVFYALLYSLIFSVFLFYITQLQFFSSETIAASYFYPFLQPLGPIVIDGLGKVIPWFKDMFDNLKDFFGKPEIVKPIAVR